MTVQQCSHFVFFLLFFHATMLSTPFSVMLNPAGDAQHTGRILDDNFERGITLQCAEQLKQALEQELPHVRIILTRFPGETLLPLQNANFSNRLQADVYISLHFYKEEAPKPHVYIYTFSYGNDFVHKPNPFSFIPYDSVYRLHTNTTNNLAKSLYKNLNSNHHTTLFTAHAPTALPHAALIGITAPAICLEAGLKNKDDWTVYIKPFAQAIAASLTPLLNQN
jgi:N-acetylmuramoyl-L-alanine amidase